MITSLTIKNYALIEDIKVPFGKGLTVITGETGAGKSILLSALGLILGNRADLKIARDPDKKCIVEGEFSIAPYGLESLFRENDMDYEPETIIRREIHPNGKSRAFVNDSPVTLNQLQLLSEFLIDVHNQYDTRRLVSESYQLSIIDAFAGNQHYLKKYQKEFAGLHESETRLAELKEEKANAIREQDYQEFVFNELQEANLDTMNQEELEADYERLSNLDAIQESLGQGVQLLEQESSGILDLLAEVRTSLARIKNFGKEYDALWERVNSVIIELQDVQGEIETSVENLEVEPNVLQEIQERLQVLYRLQKKHALESVSELVALRDSLSDSLFNFSRLDDRIADQEKACEQQRELTKEIGMKLRENRLEAIPKLEEKLKVLLQELGLPNAQFRFDLKPLLEFRKSGMDALDVLFSANKGIALAPMEKVASGGEMSRVMLAIKAVMSEYKELPTMIFDEIDTGVSGEIAHKMALILSGMSKRGQVFGITHLPQTAAKGDFHKKVFKTDEGEKTHTLIKDLNPEERILEIAQMIGGSSVSDSAIIHAKQLLN